jgi:hypothetical protein
MGWAANMGPNYHVQMVLMILDLPLKDSTVQVPRQTRKRQLKVDKERVSGAVDDIDDKVL